MAIPRWVPTVPREEGKEMLRAVHLIPPMLDFVSMVPFLRMQLLVVRALSTVLISIYRLLLSVYPHHYVILCLSFFRF